MSQLLPEHTPEWLKPALGVDPSQVQELIGNRQASSLNGTNVQVPVKREAAVLMLLSGESAEEVEADGEAAAEDVAVKHNMAVTALRKAGKCVWSKKSWTLSP